MTGASFSPEVALLRRIKQWKATFSAQERRLLSAAVPVARFAAHLARCPARLIMQIVALFVSVFSLSPVRLPLFLSAASLAGRLPALQWALIAHYQSLSDSAAVARTLHCLIHLLFALAACCHLLSTAALTQRFLGFCDLAEKQSETERAFGTPRVPYCQQNCHFKSLRKYCLNR